MNIYRFAVLSSLLMVTAGCASTSKTDAAMNSWLGSSVNELISSWGPPDSSILVSGGNRIYSWTSRGSYVVPMQTSTNTTYDSGDDGYSTIVETTQTGGGTVRYSCQQSFAVDQAGKIFAHDSKGNGCYEAKAKSETKTKTKTATVKHDDYW